MRAVLDTNVLISAFVFPGGNPEEVYRRALEGRMELVTSVALLTEFARMLTGTFGWEQPRADEAVTELVVIGTVVEPREAVQVVRDDPDDDRVLEAAHEGQAEIIVSGDRHLLALGVWREVRILDPADFLSEFE